MSGRSASAPLSVAERLMRLYHSNALHPLTSISSSPAHHRSLPHLSPLRRLSARSSNRRPFPSRPFAAFFSTSGSSKSPNAASPSSLPLPPLPSPHAQVTAPRPLSRDRILLHGLLFHAHHGVYAAERELGQRFAVDVELRVDLTRAAMTGELSETVDYGAVYGALKREVEGTQCRLLEEVAWQVMGSLMSGWDGRVEEALVRVKKPQVAVPGVIDFLGVELSRTRKEWEEDRRRIHSRKRPKDITQLTVE